MNQRARRSFAMGIATLTLAASGCEFTFPGAPADDAGDEAFVRQVVPILHGRKIRGHAETELLADLIAITNRETAVRVLMEQPQFIDHWSEVLVDDLRIEREGFTAQFSCYGAPLRTGTPDPALAVALENNDPSVAAGGGAFNMSDVLRSALVADDLFPIYRAHLYPHVNLPPNTQGVELVAREMLGAKFAETYLNRQMGCLICHNSDTSRSGAVSGWNRTYAIQGLFEKALFGQSTGEPTKDAYAMFRTDQRFGGTLAPWGISSCGSGYDTTLNVDPQNVDAHFITARGKQFGVHGLQEVLHQGQLGLKIDGLQRTLPPLLQTQCDFCKNNCAGNAVDLNAAANNAPNAAAVKQLLNTKCASCHGGTEGIDITTGSDWASDLVSVPANQCSGMDTRVIPGNAGGSYLVEKLKDVIGCGAGRAGSRMPLGQPALSAGEINTISAWINGMPPLTACGGCGALDCQQPRREVAGEEGTAFLVAAKIVDNTWEEVFGGPVTIDNYFPRTFSQRQVLWNLTEFNFVPNDWSIKSLLARMLTSDFFDRKPPRTATGTTPYDLPLVFDPWVEADPRIQPVSTQPADHNNTMADAVHRYSARSLTNSVHAALDWPKPARFPGSTYPDDALLRTIGFYFSESQPGFQVSDFQGLLSWESVHAVCQKPAGVGTDWIDRLGTATTAFTPPTGEGPLSVRDVAIVLRDWLLGSGAIGTSAPVGLTQSEEQALQQLFGVASLDEPVSNVSNLAGKLRRACGAQLQSPQFQLAGIVETGLGPKPRLRVCNDAADCTYQQMCTTLTPAIRKVIHANSRTLVLCGDDSVRIVEFPDPDRWVIPEKWCPPGLCGKLIRLVPEIYINPPVLEGVRRVERLSMRMSAPSCDPAAPRNSLASCEAPNSGPEFADGDALVAALDGARVGVAKDAVLLAADTDHYVPLERGRTLKAGDLIVVKLGGTLEVRAEKGPGIAIGPADPAAQRDAPRVLPILVTGAPGDAQTELAAELERPVPSRERIHRLVNTERNRAGEAGPPISAEARKQFRYPEHELDTTQLRERGLMPDQLRGKRAKASARE